VFTGDSGSIVGSVSLEEERAGFEHCFVIRRDCPDYLEVPAVKQYQCEKCMLETVGGLVEHSNEVKVSTEVIDAEEVRDFVDEYDVYVKELSRSDDILPVQSLIVALGWVRFPFVTLFTSTVDDAGVDYVFSADRTIHE